MDKPIEQAHQGGKHKESNARLELCMGAIVYLSLIVAVVLAC